MAANVKRYLDYLPVGAIVVDFGSLDVNGSYRQLFEPRFKYVGVDIEAGPNVDIVMPSEFCTALPAHFADAVISGQCLDHCRNPFALVSEMFRVAKPGAFVLIAAPRLFQVHSFPIDCWGILPDGMRALIEQAGGTSFAAYAIETDCWGIGKAT